MISSGYRVQGTGGKITFLMSCLICLLFSLPAYAQAISSTELINHAAQYDGKTVTYVGEVIGDVMARGNFSWLNLNDSNNAIGIWVDKNQVQDIIYTGSYKFQGDQLQVRGILHRACQEHGGDLDIHAQEIKKLASGKPLAEDFGREKRKIAVILSGGLCLALILQLFKKPLKRKSRK